MNSESKRIFEIKCLGVRRPMDGLGRVVIPKEMRDFYHIEHGSSIEIYQTNEGILLRPIELNPSKQN